MSDTIHRLRRAAVLPSSAASAPLRCTLCSVLLLPPRPSRLRLLRGSVDKRHAPASQPHPPRLRPGRLVYVRISWGTTSRVSEVSHALAPASPTRRFTARAVGRRSRGTAATNPAPGVSAPSDNCVRPGHTNRPYGPKNGGRTSYPHARQINATLYVSSKYIGIGGPVGEGGGADTDTTAPRTPEPETPSLLESPIR